MKKLLFIFILLAVVIGCSTRQTTANNSLPVEGQEFIQHDTIADTIVVKDTITLVDSDLIRQRDSIYEELVVAKYKLNRIKVYINIVDRKSSQQKYLKGWIKRVLSE